MSIFKDIELTFQCGGGEANDIRMMGAKLIDKLHRDRLNRVVVKVSVNAGDTRYWCDVTCEKSRRTRFK